MENSCTWMCEEVQDWKHNHKICTRIFIQEYRCHNVVKWIKTKIPGIQLDTRQKNHIKNTIKSYNKNKNLFGKNKKHFEFDEGDIVFIKNGNRLNRKKLDEFKIVSYEITEKLSY